MPQPETIEERKKFAKKEEYSRKMKKKDLKLCQDSNDDGTGIPGCYYWLEKTDFTQRRQCKECYNAYMRTRVTKPKERISELELQVESLDEELKIEIKKNKRLIKENSELTESVNSLKEDIKLLQTSDEKHLLRRIRELEQLVEQKDVEIKDKQDIIDNL